MVQLVLVNLCPLELFAQKAQNPFFHFLFPSCKINCFRRLYYLLLLMETVISVTAALITLRLLFLQQGVGKQNEVLHISLLACKFLHGRVPLRLLNSFIEKQIGRPQISDVVLLVLESDAKV